MEVRPGYKQTEVGVIPEDWEVEELGPHVVIHSGESPSRFRLGSEGVPYFKVEQLNNGDKYLRETPYFIVHGVKKIGRGSLIFPKRGASILLNKVRILSEDSFMDTNLMTLSPEEDLDNEYLYYALIHIQLWRVADATSIPQINNKHINPLVIPLPPLPEQRAIAAALSDADALISGLERLIEKKWAIKQGAMQELLTGKRRLPGFGGESRYKQTEVGVIPEDWEVATLGSLSFMKSGEGITSADIDQFSNTRATAAMVFVGSLRALRTMAAMR